jgi:multidrug transporter EmrE-like cation transporter
VLIFTYGGKYPEHKLFTLIIGNVIVAPSIFFLQKLYERMNLNVAYGTAIGGAFLIAQIIISIGFRSPLGLLQWFGVALMGSGMFLLAWK